MPLFLHLTDLHLGRRQPIDDVKVNLLASRERYQRVDSLEDTLTAIGTYLTRQRRSLDAVIVSGDLTDRGMHEGFRQLPRLLNRLGKAKPRDHRRIVVTPGNHDIVQGSKPGSQERYGHFLDLVAKEGYTAPPLEGVTLGREGQLTDPKQHYVLDAASGWLIVPINCADHYGSSEEPPRDFLKSWNLVVGRLPTTDTRRKTLDQGLRALLFRDVARVSKAQFRALRRILEDADASAGTAMVGIVRLAIIHHHLLPVTNIEELKPFESLTNLGALRSFLAQQHIDVLVHGHKHSRFAYWDDIYPIGGVPREHRMLVLAGETVKGNHVKDEIAQLISLQSGDHAPRVSVTTLPHCDTAEQVAARKPESFNLWTDPQAVGEMTVVRGKTLDETYDRLVALFVSSGPETPISNVVCEIEEGSTCGNLPVRYPWIDDSADGLMREQWLKSTVTWWQNDWHWPADYPYFNHGGRIRRPIDGITQWKQAIDSLHADLRSSRGLVLLVDPQHDVAPKSRRKFPAFTMLQLLVSGSEAKPRLDIIAFFRKHEMRWWWPINVAELHRLQTEALDELRTKRPEISAGRIITVSAIAKTGETVPEVAIPLVDRLADEEPYRLFGLAYACFHTPTSKAAALSDWESLIEDLKPPASMNVDGVPVAIRGLELLIQYLESFAASSKKTKPQRLIKHLRDVLERNRGYASKSAANEVDRGFHDEWKERVNEDLTGAMAVARGLIRQYA